MRAAAAATVAQPLPTTSRSTSSAVNSRRRTIAPITLRLIGLNPPASCSITTNADEPLFNVAVFFSKVIALWPPAVIYPPAPQHSRPLCPAGALGVPPPKGFAGAAVHPQPNSPGE